MKYRNNILLAATTVLLLSSCYVKPPIDTNNSVFNNPSSSVTPSSPAENSGVNNNSTTPSNSTSPSTSITPSESSTPSNSDSSSPSNGDSSSPNIGAEIVLDSIDASNFVEVNGNKALHNGDDFKVVFEKTNDKYEVAIVKSSDNTATYKTNNSVNITIRDKGQILGYNTSTFNASYETISKQNYGYLLSATIETTKGSRFLVEDAYYITKSKSYAVDRNVTVVNSVNADYGFESNIVFYEVSNSADYTQFDYFIPSIIYKDTNHMAAGICANMNLDTVYVKETRTGLPMAMVRHKTNGNALSLAHIEPEISIGNSTGGSNGSVDERIEYGSVGIHVTTPTVGVGFTYPCYEGPVSYDSGGRKFHPVENGFTHSYKLGIIPDNSSTYNDSMVNSYVEAYDADEKYIAEMDIDEIYEQNMTIYKSEYKEYSNTAGFPFSLDLPNGTNSEGISFAMGFIGQQIPAGFHMYNYGIKNNNNDIKAKGEKILNFWSSGSVNSTYFPNIWYETNGSARNMPVFLRYIVDGMEGMIDAYRLSVKVGQRNQNWYNMITRVGTNLVNKQNADGSFYRAYNTDGSVCIDKTDNRTQGDSPTNTPIAVRYLAKMYEVTGEQKYKDSALKAANYCYNELYQKLGKYVGGTPDNPNTVDKEAAVYAMYCFASAYQLSGEARYLKAAEHATICALSWTYAYDFVVPDAKTDDEDKNPFKDGGVIGFSMIATGHSAADNYSAYTYFETYKMYVLTGNEFYKNAALLLQNNTKLSSDYDGKLGYKYKAMTPEATRVADFAFSSVGTWLTWQGVANIEPMVDFEECFGTKDILKLTDSFETQQNKINAYGCGGKGL